MWGKKKQPRAHQQSEALTQGVWDERSLQPDPAPRGELMAALCVHTRVHVCVHPTLQLWAAPITPKPSGLAGWRMHTLSTTTDVSQGQHRLPKSAWGRTQPRGAPRGSPDPAAAPPGSPFLLPWDRSQQHRGTGQGDAAPSLAALPFPPPEPSFNPSTPARCQRCTFFFCFFPSFWVEFGSRAHTGSGSTSFGAAGIEQIQEGSDHPVSASGAGSPSPNPGCKVAGGMRGGHFEGAPDPPPSVQTDGMLQPGPIWLRPRDPPPKKKWAGGTRGHGNGAGARAILMHNHTGHGWAAASPLCSTAATLGCSFRSRWGGGYPLHPPPQKSLPYTLQQQLIAQRLLGQSLLSGHLQELAQEVEGEVQGVGFPLSPLARLQPPGVSWGGGHRGG